MVINTLPEINSKFAPENGWLEDVGILFGARPIFQGRTASFREGKRGEMGPRTKWPYN